MRVLYVTSADDKYGAPKSMIDMIRPLADYCDIEPIVIANCEGRMTDFCDQYGIAHHLAKSSEFMVVGGSNTFRKIVKHSVAPLLALKYHKGKNNAVRSIEKKIDLRTIDVIHTNVNRVNTGAILAKKYKIPHIWHLREFCKEDYNCMSLIPGFIKYMNENATTFVAISDAVKKAWIEKGLDEAKIVVINDGITHSDFKCKSEYREKREEPLKIVFCGLVSETKGQKVLIDAINMLSKEEKNIFVDFYGGGRKEYIAKLDQLVRSYGLSEQIKFRGYSSSLNKDLASYDVGVVASRAEALGRATVEYMYAGLYVIASDTGANPDILGNGAYGTLYKQGNPEELKKAILTVMNSPDRAKKTALLAKKYAENRFDLRKSASEIYNLYTEISETQKKI